MMKTHLGNSAMIRGTVIIPMLEVTREKCAQKQIRIGEVTWTTGFNNRYVSFRNRGNKTARQVRDMSGTYDRAMVPQHQGII